MEILAFEFRIVGIECMCASLHNIFGRPFNININGLWIIRVVPSNDFNFMLVITRQIENNLGSFIPLNDHIINIFSIVNQKVQHCCLKFLSFYLILRTPRVHPSLLSTLSGIVILIAIITCFEPSVCICNYAIFN